MQIQLPTVGLSVLCASLKLFAPARGITTAGKGYRHRDAINMTVAEPKVLMVVGNVRMRLAARICFPWKK